MSQSSKSANTKRGPGYPVPVPYPFADAPKFPTSIGTQAEGAVPHACMGLNSCKGQDRFGVHGAPGIGPNACAGQGFCSTAVDHTCHVQNACKSQGGCGLYGTTEEMNNPGQNACRSLGSCATPINAERFITNGPNRGTSVWKRAREVFAKKVWPELKKNNPSLPDTPPDPGGQFSSLFKQGPSYLWISDDNTERGNMTACGASGMSGAGGCA